MHFLLTNDDGIQAAGLRTLAEVCRELGHRVTVAAPASQQSAASHRITISDPLMAQRVPWEGADAWAVAGTPADCARLGLRLADGSVDYVFSGMNDGENAGCAVFYSGTFAAAQEARMCGKPAMAVSIDVNATEEMRRHLARTAISLAEITLPLSWPRMGVLNLNAPALPPQRLLPLTVCPPSDAYFLDNYEQRVSPRGQLYFWLGKGMIMEPHRPGTDCDLLEKGHITLSMIGGCEDHTSWFREIPLPGLSAEESGQTPSPAGEALT